MTLYCDILQIDEVLQSKHGNEASGQHVEVILLLLPEILLKREVACLFSQLWFITILFTLSLDL